MLWLGLFAVVIALALGLSVKAVVRHRKDHPKLFNQL